MFSKDLKKAFLNEVEIMVDEKIQEIPVVLKIDGKYVDCDSISYEGGEIEINIKSPVFFPETDRIAAVEILPKEDEIEKELIQNNPEMYNSDKHEKLFTAEELTNLSLSMRGVVWKQ